MAVDAAPAALNTYGYHGALDAVEGAGVACRAQGRELTFS